MPRSLAVPAVCFGLMLSLAATAHATAPTLSNVVPRGGQRGTEVEVTLTGERLEDAQELMLYEPGIEVSDLKAVNGNQLKAKLKIAADCALGTKRLRVRTATGLSTLRTFIVGALPVVQEKEPNSEFTAPQPIEKNVTVEGLIQNEDQDYFLIEAKQGERINVEIEGIRLGNSFFDPYLAILNEERFELTTSDDKALVYQDGVASFTAPRDGKYRIQIRESAYGGSGAAYYRCHIGNFPRPLAVVPSGGKPGETLTVKFLGDPAGEITQQVTLPQMLDPEFGLHAQDQFGIAPSANPFRLSELDNLIEQEPNNALEQATKFQPPLALNGVVSAADDLDYFRFTVKKGEVYDIRVYARQLRSELDPVLSILNAQGRAVANNDDTGGPDSYVRFNPPADGDYLVHVRDHLGNGGPGYFYRIELTRVQPKLELGVNEFVQYVQPIVAIPKGNRVPLLISAARRDFGGPLAFRGEDLPEGVTIESFDLAADQNVAQVLFTATPEAAVSGKLAKVIGVLNDPKQQTKVEGYLRHDAILVRGQNQRPVWTEPAHRLAVAVVEESPFSLEIIEPKVPLVQGGSMQLKVKTHRKEGFTAPIKIFTVLNPPGVNSSVTAKIEEGKAEGTIDINAAGNAKVGEHKISIRGEATVGNGPLMVASPFATLKVAERYLNFAFQATAVEQGQETELVVNVEKLTDFEGAAKVQLLGLPNKVTTEPTEITKDAKEIVFKVKADAAAPVGQSKNLFCQVIVTENGEPILHNLGTGQLRVDKPLPKPAAKPVAKNSKQPAPDQPKRLTRLEQLRLEQKQRLEAQK